MPLGEPIVHSSQRDRQLAPLLHFGFLLVGLVHTLLGPILPMLAARWRLDEAEAGSLFIAQFTGVMIGCAIEPDDRTVGSLRLVAFSYAAMAAAVACLGVNSWGIGLLSVFSLGFAIGLTAPAKSPGCGDQFGTSRGGAEYPELRVGAGRGRRPAADRPVRARRTSCSTIDWTGDAAVRYCLVDCASPSYGFFRWTQSSRSRTRKIRHPLGDWPSTPGPVHTHC